MRRSARQPDDYQVAARSRSGWSGLNELGIGGVTVDRDEALDHARRYLTDGSGWAYPAYDVYEADRAAGPLTDADLLAPVLLNVNRLSIRTRPCARSSVPSCAATPCTRSVLQRMDELGCEPALRRLVE